MLKSIFIPSQIVRITYNVETHSYQLWNGQGQVVSSVYRYSAHWRVQCFEATLGKWWKVAHTDWQVTVYRRNISTRHQYANTLRALREHGQDSAEFKQAAAYYDPAIVTAAITSFSASERAHRERLEQEEWLDKINNLAS